MSVFLAFFNGQILPILALIVPIIALFKGWVRPQQTIFEQREKLSKHSYELYKISNDESLKKLSIEYGYAAITKDNFLSFEQRKALVNSLNPVHDVDIFTKCRYLLNIKVDPLAFEWKSKRYRKKSYLNFARVCRIFFYCVGCFVLTLPLTFEKILPSTIVNLDNVPIMTKFLMVLYCVGVGGRIAWANLIGGRRLTQAMNLINRHERS